MLRCKQIGPQSLASRLVFAHPRSHEHDSQSAFCKLLLLLLLVHTGLRGETLTPGACCGFRNHRREQTSQHTSAQAEVFRCCSSKQWHLQGVGRGLAWAAVAGADNHDGGVVDARVLCTLGQLGQHQLVRSILRQHNVGGQQHHSRLQRERGESLGVWSERVGCSNTCCILRRSSDHSELRLNTAD